MIDRYDAWTGPLGLRHVMDRLFRDAFILPSDGQATSSHGGALDVYREGDNLVV
jgi:hypothetical protein